MTATSRLARRRADAAPGPRDNNGIAADADAAVQRAGSSTGQGLPDDLRQRFVASTGADLSGVRVHTGAESATAATAVGARAYTVGQDIHFADGAYQPGDPFGVHLLAHEVAHTVQQAGGSVRRQHKLEVTTPGDAAEVEADRAADAMVAGTPVTIGGGSMQVAREAAPKAPIFVEFSKTGMWKGEEVIATLSTLVTVPDDLKAAILAGPERTAVYCVELRKRAAAAGADAETSAALTSRITELVYATPSSPLTYRQLGDVAGWAAKYPSTSGATPGAEPDAKDAARDPAQPAAGGPGAAAADLLTGAQLATASDRNAARIKAGEVLYHELQSAVGAGLVMNRRSSQNGVTGASQKEQSWSDALGPTSLAIAAKQKELGVSPIDGCAEDSTLTALGFKRRGKLWMRDQSKLDWAAADAADRTKLKGEEAEAQKVGTDQAQSVDARRAAIVSLARAQIGTVDQSDRGDGKKYGGVRISEYYDVVLGKPTGAKQADILAEGKFANDTARAELAAKKAALEKRVKDGETLSPADQKNLDSYTKKTANAHMDDWSWCGIFALYCVKAATGIGGWEAGAGPTGMTAVPTKQTQDGLAAAHPQPGDVLAIKSTNNHHVLLSAAPAADGSGTLSTVEGNIEAQGVRESQRFTFANVTIVYKPF